MTFATIGHGIVIVILLILAGGCFFIWAMPTSEEFDEIFNAKDGRDAD